MPRSFTTLLSFLPPKPPWRFQGSHYDPFRQSTVVRPNEVPCPRWSQRSHSQSAAGRGRMRWARWSRDLYQASKLRSSILWCAASSFWNLPLSEFTSCIRTEGLRPPHTSSAGHSSIRCGMVLQFLPITIETHPTCANPAVILGGYLWNSVIAPPR